MNELFAKSQLGTLPEERWRAWADGLVGIGYFTAFGVPDQRVFKDWKSWAIALVGTIQVAGK